jgi:hypothetical protein
MMLMDAGEKCEEESSGRKRDGGLWTCRSFCLLPIIARALRGRIAGGCVRGHVEESPFIRAADSLILQN